MTGSGDRGAPPARIWRFGNVTVEPAAFRATIDGVPSRIEPKALEVLIYLVERRDRVVTKQELLDAVWSDVTVTENALTRAVAQIRKVLGDDLQSPRYIRTVPTKGYCFIAPVEEGESEPPVTAVADEREQPVVAPPPVLAAGVVAPPDVAPPVRRSPLRTFVVLVVLFVAAAAAIAAVAVFRWKRGVAARAAAESHQPEKPAIAARPLRPAAGLHAFPAFSPDAAHVAYSAVVDDVPHIFRVSLAGGEPVRITDGDGETQPSWSPDGKQIAYVSLRRGGIWIVSAEGGQPTQLTSSGSRPAWSPDGREIAFQSGETLDYGWTAFDALPPSVISVVDLATGRVDALTGPGVPAGGHGAPSWRADGTRIAFSSCDIERCGIFTVARDGSGLHEIVNDRRRLASPRFAAGGRELYYVLTRYDDSLLLSVAVTGAGERASQPPRRLRSSGPGTMQHLAVSRDGSRLAWTVAEESSDLFATAARGSGEATQLTRNAKLRATYPAWSPDGAKLAYCAVAAGDDSGVWVLDGDGGNAKALAVAAGLKQHTGWMRSGYDVVFNAWSVNAPALFRGSLITGRVEKMATAPSDASSAVLSPDETALAFNRTIAGETSVWTRAASGGGDGRQIAAARTMARLPVWSPSGKQLAMQVRTPEGSAVGVVLAAGGPVRLLENVRGESHPYGWSPDEREIVFAGRRAGVWNVYAVDVADGTTRQITNNTSTVRWVRTPAWSPKGDRIVYESGAPEGSIWISEAHAVQ